MVNIYTLVKRRFSACIYGDFASKVMIIRSMWNLIIKTTIIHGSFKSLTSIPGPRIKKRHTDEEHCQKSQNASVNSCQWKKINTLW